MRFNRMANTKNEFQGNAKRVLCVCSAGLLRSPTAAVVLAGEPFNYNTRAAGINAEYALVPVDEVLIHWADEIVCMEPDHAEILQKMVGEKNRPIFCLNIDDRYAYRDPDLVWLIQEKYKACLDTSEAPDEG